MKEKDKEGPDKSRVREQAGTKKASGSIFF